MARYRIIDTATWPRRAHFTFYRQFANPSFNLCVPIAAQRLYECAKDRRVSFFQLALYALLRAANGVPQLRQRVRNDEVIEYDSLAVMTPVMTVEGRIPPGMVRQRPRVHRLQRCGNAEDRRGKRDNAGAAHRRWRAFYLRQLSAVAPLHLDDPCGICRRRGGARAYLGKLQNGVIPVAGRFNHAFVDGLHASRFLLSWKRDLATPSGSGNR